MMMGGMGGSGGSGNSMGMMDMDMMGMGGGASQSMNGMNMGSMGNMSGTGYVTDPSMAGMMANHGANTGIFGTGGSLFGGIFNLAIDLLAILLLVGLVAGTVILIKRYVLDGELLTTQTKTACTHCGSKLETNWNCCPKCGTVKINAQKIDVSPQTV